MPAFSTDPTLLFLTAALAYLLGSVPFGMVFARVFGLGNLREIGSGNIGATNVLRTGNKLAAFLTLLFDAGKGGLAVLIARLFLAEDAAQVAGFFAFLGHLFPIYLKFQGGKGVATFFGTILVLSLPVGLAAGATWLVVAAIFRYSSLAALVAAVACPFWAFLLDYRAMILLAFLLAQLIFLRHQANIKRLFAKEEPRIGRKG